MKIFRFANFLCILLFGVPESAFSTAPDTVIIGAYITSLHDFRISENSIKADIHLWCLYENDDYDFERELEFLNCNNLTLGGTAVEKVNGRNWYYTKALLETRQDYSTVDFPFDKQNIRFSIESSEYTTDDLVFKPDKIGSTLDSIVHAQFDEWTISELSFTSSETEYHSSFGADTVQATSFSPRFDISMEITRKGSWLILFKLTTGILVAFMISTCVFWIKPSNTDPRFGLCVGGLFASIGNKYIVDSIVPPSNESTLLDYLHNVTFIYILIIIIISVVSLRLYESDSGNNTAMSQRLDKISYFTIVGSYWLFVTISTIEFL
jgi:hypothetical protein